MADEHWVGLRHATWNTNCLSWLTRALEEEMRRRVGDALEYEVPGRISGKGCRVYKEVFVVGKSTEQEKTQSQHSFIQTLESKHPLD